MSVLNIAVSSRSLAAARTIDPQVSPAAVYAAVEAAIAEQLRQLGPRASTAGGGDARGRVVSAGRP
jgi:hypothetical protein